MNLSDWIFWVASDPFPTSFQRADPFWWVGLAETFAVAFWYIFFSDVLSKTVARTRKNIGSIRMIRIFELKMKVSCFNPKLPNFFSSLFSRQQKIWYGFEVHLPGRHSRLRKRVSGAKWRMNRSIFFFSIFSHFWWISFSAHFFVICFFWIIG